MTNQKKEALAVRKPVNEEKILQVAKEVVVKFIEVGRLSPQNFTETFESIYASVHNAVRSRDHS